MNSIRWLYTGGAILTLAMTFGMSWLSPNLSRRDLFFSVTTDPSRPGSPEGQEILRRFRLELFWFSLPALGIVLLGAILITKPVYCSFLFGPSVFLQLTGATISYTRAHRRAMAYSVSPSMEREAVVAPRRVELPGGWLAQLGPFVILGVACLYLARHWNEIPQRFPIHWGIDGKADGWAAKSIGAASLGPLTGVGICLLLAGLMYGVVRGSRRVFNSGKKAAGEARYLRSILWLTLGLEYGMAITFGYMGLLPLPFHPPFWAFITAETVVVGGFTMAIVVVAIRSGQGGWKLGGAEIQNGPPVGDRTPDECWKAGLFYYNPNDPALWVEKRFGVGWTTNFANPRAWWLLGGILLLAVLPFLLLR